MPTTPKRSCWTPPNKPDAVNRRSWIAFLTTLLLLPLTGAGRAQLPPACTWSVGIMGALSGDYGSIGRPMANGIQLAIDQANSGGDLACTLEVHAEDTQGNPSVAPRKAQKLTKDEKVVACICGFFSGETLASGSIFSRAGLAMASTGANRMIQRQGFKTWFRAIASDVKQGSVTVTYIKNGLDARKVNVVHDTQDYSKGLAQDVFDKLGKRMTGKHMYIINPEETDYSAVVAQIKDRNPDVVYYGGYLPQAGELLRQLHDEGVRATFVTDDGALDDEIQRAIRGRPVDAFAACPCSDPARIDGGPILR
jgi:branched-chain amino acid transport system substrate-binding protein